jgi:hypothetical protein
MKYVQENANRIDFHDEIEYYDSDEDKHYYELFEEQMN